MKHTNQLLYHRPAERWTEASPLGCGRLGMMVYGRVNEECISLNEDSLWMGNGEDRTNPKALKHLEEVRKFILDGQLEKAEQLAQETLVSSPQKFGPYTTFGEFMIQELDETDRQGKKPKYYSYKNYERRLNLQTGILTITYQKQNITYTREYFVSYPDQVMVIHMKNDGGVPMDYATAFMDGANDISAVLDDEILIHERLLSEGGISCCGAVCAMTNNGPALTNRILNAKGYLRPLLMIRKASEVTFYLSITSDFDNEDPRNSIEVVKRAREKGYEKVKEDHIQDFTSYYNRFVLEFADGFEEIDTMELLDKAHDGLITPGFIELYMNSLRYLFLSSSRAGSKPSNMQGVWNEQKHPIWESDYHTNVNLQMNYWPSKAWNLEESVMPLCDWIESIVPAGRVAMKKTYGVDGWSVHHCSNLFGFSNIAFGIVGIWPLGGLWLCKELYDYYDYTGDKKILKERFYPIMKEAFLFLKQFLIKAPEGSECPGKYITCPSVSPENVYINAKGEHGMLTYMPTMDISLIQDFLTIYEEVVREIDCDETELEAIHEIKENLPEVQISQRTGGIQEWIEDYEEEDPGHRHVSQLYGVFPGQSITPETTPELCEAAKKSIQRKLDQGYHGQGWCLGWISNILARLRDGEKAFEFLRKILEEQLLPNMMVNSHGYPQVGDAMSGPSALLEMLAQSHTDKIVLLPCLPKELPNGHLKGMRLRGGYELEMTWKDGELVKAVLEKVHPGKEKEVVYSSRHSYRITKNENTIRIEKE